MPVARFRAAWTTALVCAAFSALLEARWASAVATEPLAPARLWLVCFGLLVPPALGAALSVTLLWPTLGALGTGARSPQAPPAFLPLLGAGVAVTLALLARLALALWALGLEPWTAAVLLALGVWLAARSLPGAWLELSQVRSLRRLSLALPRALSLSLAIATFGGLVAYGIAEGSGDGELGFWGIFAVLARPELDLRAASLASVSLALIYLRVGRAGVAGGHGSARRSRSALIIASGLAAGAWAATAFRLLEDEPLSLALERGGALTQLSLRVQRAATDRDGDRVAAWFGGRDCDDGRGDIHPGAVDLPGNGIDEDCSGADDESVSLALAPEPPPAPAEPATNGAAPRVPPGLNVLLITVDTLRHDLGYAGYPRPVSANIDRLASRSVVFDRAYSLASYTGKSIGPLMLGKYPSETHRGYLHFNRFGKDETFVQERLQAAGIHTLSVQSHWYFSGDSGLGRGFDVLDLSASPLDRQLEGDKTVDADRLTAAALARLSALENTAAPFFMWVHYVDPHADYIPHEGFDFGRRARDLYDSEVAFTDQQIGRLLDFVAASPFAGRTAIVLTSDHGEAFGEHGMWRHGAELWEALVKVPLITYVPGVQPHHIAPRRSAVDLAPTLLALFGVPLPEGDARLSGRALTDDIFMPAGGAPEERPVFIDMSEGPYNEERQALIQNDMKLIMCTGRVIGLYDLARDPDELVDLRADRALLATARAQFMAFQRQLRTVRVNPTDANVAP